MSSRKHNITGDLKVSVSGVRGIVGESLTPGLVAGFTTAFGQYVGGGKVIVGRDTRPSGAMLEHAVIASLLAVGCQPVLAGVVPTPTVQMLVDKYRASGGVVISASHNPVEWNALKFIGASGTFLNYNEAAELQDIYNQPDNIYVAEHDYRNIRYVEDPFEVHRKRIFSKIDVEAIRNARFKVAVDCCNGAGAIFARPFLEALGCEVFAINDQPDGIFRRNPEPVPENMQELSRTVLENHCDIGFAQDPDADRIGVVRSNGEALSEQSVLVLAVDHVLSGTNGNVVVNIQTTKAVEDVAASYNCATYYSKVGEINVSGLMKQKRAVIGGEGSSGGVIYPDVYPCRDSFTAMALMLEMLAMSGESIDDIVDSMPMYVSVSRKFSCDAGSARNIVRKLKVHYRELNPITIDGIRINFSRDAWILVRPSNTEPVIRLYVEARTQEQAHELLENFVAELEELRKA